MIHEIKTPLPVDTPLGTGYAHFLIEHGDEHHLQWVCFIDATGECWTFENPDIRLQSNLTLGRPPRPQPKWRKQWQLLEN